MIPRELFPEHFDEREIPDAVSPSRGSTQPAGAPPQHAVTPIFELCSASPVDDRATADSSPKFDVLHRCVWRATPGSASDG